MKGLVIHHPGKSPYTKTSSLAMSCMGSGNPSSSTLGVCNFYVTVKLKVIFPASVGLVASLHLSQFAQ